MRRSTNWLFFLWKGKDLLATVKAMKNNKVRGLEITYFNSYCEARTARSVALEQ